MVAGVAMTTFWRAASVKSVGSRWAAAANAASEAMNITTISGARSNLLQ
jgi:hypothetical protein